MNKIEKQKAGLFGLGIGLAVISLLALIGGILMIALGIKLVVLIICGALLVFLSLIGIVISIYFIWISRAIKATKGSIEEDNLGYGRVQQATELTASQQKAREDINKKK